MQVSSHQLNRGLVIVNPPHWREFLGVFENFGRHVARLITHSKYCLLIFEIVSLSVTWTRNYGNVPLPEENIPQFEPHLSQQLLAGDHSQSLKADALP